jgi:hypothetical protein
VTSVDDVFAFTTQPLTPLNILAFLSSIARLEQLQKPQLFTPWNTGPRLVTNKQLAGLGYPYCPREQKTHSLFHLFTVNFDVDCCGIMATKAHYYTFLCGVKVCMRSATRWDSLVAADVKRLTDPTYRLLDYQVILGIFNFVDECLVHCSPATSSRLRT